MDPSLIAELRHRLVAHLNRAKPDALPQSCGVPCSWGVAFDRALAVGFFRRDRLGPGFAGEGLDPIRSHDLRHTFASLALAAGFQPYEGSRWLGHANRATTDAI